VLSWEDRAKLAEIEENLAAEDPHLAARMRTRPRPPYVPQLAATLIALSVAAPVLMMLPTVVVLVTVAVLVTVVDLMYRRARRSGRWR
jgi:Flp pilus assembly protein TadB